MFKMSELVNDNDVEHIVFNTCEHPLRSVVQTYINIRQELDPVSLYRFVCSCRKIRPTDISTWETALFGMLNSILTSKVP